jgi:hypothetical protein
LTEQWNGHERRQPTEDGREGRRPTDRHCAQHDILWDHHEQDKENYRVATCGQLTALNAEIDKMMPRWVLLWVGIPSMMAMLVFVSWVSIKGISNSESIIEMKAEQKATSANVVQLMKHFDLTPVPVKPKQ